MELPSVIPQPIKPVTETLVKELRAQTIVSPPSPKEENITKLASPVGEKPFAEVVDTNFEEEDLS